MLNKLYAAAISILLIASFYVSASPPSSFNSAKRIAEQKIYHDQTQSFYCDCAFDFESGPNLESCGYEIRKQANRANRIEWEHVMPAQPALFAGDLIALLCFYFFIESINIH